MRFVVIWPLLITGYVSAVVITIHNVLRLAAGLVIIYELAV